MQTTRASTLAGLVRFNEANPAHYRLFNVRTFVAPVGGAASPFLAQRAQFGPMRVFDGPGDGYFDVVDAFPSVAVNRDTFYDVNDRWLRSDWIWAMGIPSVPVRLRADGALGAALQFWMIAAPPFDPHVAVTAGGLAEIKPLRSTPFFWSGQVEAQTPAAIRMRIAYFPGWNVLIDGRHIEAGPAPVSGLLTFPVPQGIKPR